MAARRRVTVFTHQRADEVRPALTRLIACARRHGIELRFDPEETRKHGLQPDADGVIVVDADPREDVELCIVLGGDGTILRGLRCYAGQDVPVFSVNFGEVGFLATIDPDELEEFGFECAFAGAFEVLLLPAIVFRSGGGGEHKAFNDISFHRKIGGRVAQLSYGVQGEEVGSVRCDGLVVCTPAGSTGYNLANGGPVLAWGVEGYVVSFIAPHSLTARALVVAPLDVLTLQNRSHDVVDITVDGRPVGELGPGDTVDARFEHEAALLAQAPGTSFYRRIREKFGKLA